MSQKYEASEVESKWREKWASDGLYKADLSDSDSKYYNLVMFPYPSGDKLHIGHWFSYAPADSWGRYMRMNGKNVFEPIGFDSFGLPAENYAIKTGTPPAESTTKNVEYMREQLRAMGTMYDWDQEVVTSSPEYYKWTQWIFLKLYERGLAYRKKAPVNWCPSCKTVLANEQAQDGTCERCDSEVTKKDLTQWFFNIRKYAEKLLNHDELDWPERTKLMQKNWASILKNSLLVEAQQEVTLLQQPQHSKNGIIKRMISVFPRSRMLYCSLIPFSIMVLVAMAIMKKIHESKTTGKNSLPFTISMVINHPRLCSWGIEISIQMRRKRNSMARP